MRVLVAPDKFAGTLTAVEAAEAIADGWARQAPGRRPRPGADVRRRARASSTCCTPRWAASCSRVTVPGRSASPPRPTVLRVGGTAYVESAQACGLHLTGRRARRAGRRRRGVGELSSRPSTRVPRRWSSGSAAAAPTTGEPGCWPRWARRPTAPSTPGRRAWPASPRSISRPAADALAGVDLVAASDVDNPLAGLFGATKTFGPQKGLPEERLPIVDGWLERVAAVVDRRTALRDGRRCGRRPRASPCSPSERTASPGIDAGRRGGRPGRAGARRRPRGDRGGRLRLLLPLRQGALRRRAGRRRGACGRASPSPGQVLVGSREMRALGVESAYSLVDLVGEERAFGDAGRRAGRRWPSGSRGPGPADGPQRGGMRGITPDVRPLDLQ